VFAGREYGLFDPAAREAFFHYPFIVLPQSDRMGYRLRGPVLQRGELPEMISETVTMGTVQVPPDGQPLILMADRQTTGGYPRIAQAAAVDLPVLAQLKPGDTVQFQEISFAEAEALLLAREESMRLMKQAVKMVMERMRSDVLD
jgi:antagonist of KipI